MKMWLWGIGTLLLLAPDGLSSHQFASTDSVVMDAAGFMERSLFSSTPAMHSWPVAGGDAARTFALSASPITKGAAGIVAQTAMPGLEGSPVIDSNAVLYTVLPSVPEPSSSSMFGHVRAVRRGGEGIVPLWSWTASTTLLPGHALWEAHTQATRLLYVASTPLSDGSHVLYCLDADSGVQLWRSDPILHPITAPLAVLGTGAALVPAGPFLQAYNPLDGSLLWSVNAGGTYPITSILHTEAGGVGGVVAVTTAESVTAVAAGSGKILWKLLQMPSNLQWLVNVTISFMGPVRLEAVVDDHPSGAGPAGSSPHPCPLGPVIYVASTVWQQLQQVQTIFLIATNVSAYCLLDRTLLWSSAHPVFTAPSPVQSSGVHLSLLRHTLWVTPAQVERPAGTTPMQTEVQLYGLESSSGAVRGTWSIPLVNLSWPDPSLLALRFLLGSPLMYVSGQREEEGVGCILGVVNPLLRNARNDAALLLMDIHLTLPPPGPGAGAGAGSGVVRWSMVTHIQTPRACTPDACDLLAWTAHAVAVAHDGSMYLPGTEGALLTLATCPAGYECGGQAGAVATPCRPGTYAGEEGSTACELCPAGFVFAASGAVNCSAGVSCPSGHYCPPGSGQAVPCPLGTFNPQAGSRNASYCMPCGPSPVNLRRGHASWASCAACGSAVSCAGAPMSGRSAYSGARSVLQGVAWMATTRGQDSTAELSAAITATPAGLILRHSEAGIMVLDPSSGAFLQLYIVGPVASAAALLPGAPIAVFAASGGTVFAIDTEKGRWGWHARTACSYYNAIPIVYPLQATYTLSPANGTSEPTLVTAADFTRHYVQGRNVPIVDMCNGTGMTVNLTSGSATSVRTSLGPLYASNSACTVYFQAPPGHTLTLIPQLVELDFTVKEGKSMADFRVDTREAIMTDHLLVYEGHAGADVLAVLQYSTAMLPLAGLLKTTAYPVLHAAAGQMRLHFVSDASKEAAGIHLTVIAVPMLPRIQGPEALLVFPCLSTGAVHALHAANGTVAWTASGMYWSPSQNRTVRRGALAMPGSIAPGRPDVLYLLDAGATLHSLHARTGAQIRVVENAASPYLLPAVDPMLLSSNVLEVYFAASQIPVVSANGLVVSPQTGAVFVLQIGGQVSARDGEGALLWTTQLRPQLRPTKLDYIGRPVLSPDDTLLYVGNAQGQMWALFCTNGTVAWEVDFGLPAEVGTDGVTDFTPLFFSNLWSPITPAVDAEGYLYTVSIYGSVYCLHGHTGHVVWRVLVMNNANGVTLLPSGAVLAFGTSIISVQTVPAGMTYDGEKRYIRGGVTIAPCRPGTFRSAPEEEACRLCPTGLYTPFRAETAGLPQVDCSSALPCIAGSYCPPGSRAPIPCDPGTFSPGPAASECIACPMGTYQAGRGATDCVLCEAGTASSARGQRSARSCSICPPGSYSSASGSAVCQACEAGSYSSIAGAKACSLCPVGSYSNAVGASSNTTCLPCPAGTFAVAGGQSIVSCLACPPGTSHGGTGSIGQDTCEACKAGFFSGTGSATCTACPAGTYASGAGSRACSVCPRSTYQPMTNATSPQSCLPCPPGTRTGSAGSSSATDCEAVQYSCPDGLQIRAGLSTARTESDCVPLLCQHGTQVRADRKGCQLCPVGTRPTAAGACQPCTTTSGTCLGLLSFPLLNGTSLNATLVSPSLATPPATTRAQGGRALQAAGQQSAGGSTSCPPLRSSTAARVASTDSWSYIFPTVGALAALACVTLLLFSAGLCLRYRNMRATAQHVLHGRHEQHQATHNMPFTERWLRSMDVFDLEHPVDEHSSPVKRATALGGLFSALAWTAVLALSSILLIQFSTDNTLQVQSLEVPSVTSEGLVLDAQGKAMAQAERGTVVSSASWWDTLMGAGSAQASGQTAAARPLQGIELRMVVQGEPGACAVPLQWSQAGLAGGSFKLTTVADCAGTGAQAGTTGRVSQLAWVCDDCYFTRGSEIRALLHWSCQALLIEAAAANTDGSTRVLTSSAAATSQDGLLSSLDISLATLLTVQVDQRGAYVHRDSTGSKDGMGYQLISLSKQVEHDPSPFTQGHPFIPNEHSVRVKISFPQEALFAKVTLTDKQSPFDLISSIMGLGGMFGAFGAVFAFLEPLLLQAGWWRRLFGLPQLEGAGPAGIGKEQQGGVVGMTPREGRPSSATQEQESLAFRSAEQANPAREQHDPVPRRTPNDAGTETSFVAVQAVHAAP